MTTFLVAATFVTAAVLFLITRPLLRPARAATAGADDVNAAVYRDQLAELDAQLADGSLEAGHHARAREAVRARLAADLGVAGGVVRGPIAARGLAAGIVVALAVSASLLYALLGTPSALQPQAKAAPAADANAHGLQGAQIAAMVQRLATRLAADPGDLNGWVMLARSYSALGRFDDAGRAYAEAAKLSPQDAPLLADYADILTMAQGRSFEGEPDRLIARALAVDPTHVKSLALAGSSAFARRDYAGAASLWGRVLDQVPAGSDMGRRIEASIAQARALGGEAAPAGAASISGTARLAPGLAGRMREGSLK